MNEQEKRESVIKEFKNNYRPYSPGYAHVLVRNWAVRDAIDLLKSQEPKYPIRKQSKHGWFFYCPKCEIILNDMARPKYCSECGQAVKWIG